MPREKDKEREKKNERKRRKYGQARLKQSKMGKISCFIAAVIAVLLIGLVNISYHSDGNSACYIGGIGLSALLFSIIGIMTAKEGFKENERNFRTCRIGIVCNTIFLISWIIFFLGGII